MNIKIDKMFSIVSLLVFAIIAFCILFLPKLTTRKHTLAGKVESISEPSKRSGHSTIEVSENGRIMLLYYTFLDNVKEIEVGDSLFKSSNSMVLFIKHPNDGLIYRGRDENFQLSK